MLCEKRGAGKCAYVRLYYAAAGDSDAVSLYDDFFTEPFNTFGGVCVGETRRSWGRHNECGDKKVGKSGERRLPQVYYLTWCIIYPKSSTVLLAIPLGKDILFLHIVSPHFLTRMSYCSYTFNPNATIERNLLTVIEK